MGKCQNCDGECDDQYKFCKTCNEEYKKNQAKKNQPQTPGNDNRDELGRINNNLYGIRTILNRFAEINHGETLAWIKGNDEKMGHFEMVEIKKEKKAAT